MLFESRTGTRTWAFTPPHGVLCLAPKSGFLSATSSVLKVGSNFLLFCFVLFSTQRGPSWACLWSLLFRNKGVGGEPASEHPGLRKRRTKKRRFQEDSKAQLCCRLPPPKIAGRQAWLGQREILRNRVQKKWQWSVLATFDFVDSVLWEENMLFKPGGG